MIWTDRERVALILWNSACSPLWTLCLLRKRSPLKAIQDSPTPSLMSVPIESFPHFKSSADNFRGVEKEIHEWKKCEDYAAFFLCIMNLIQSAGTCAIVVVSWAWWMVAMPNHLSGCPIVLVLCFVFICYVLFSSLTLLWDISHFFLIIWSRIKHFAVEFLYF